MKDKTTSNRLIITAVIGLLTIGAVLAAIISFKQTAKVQENIEQAMVEEQEKYSAEEKWAEGTITYNGKHYQYNTNLKTYLFMGIDKDGVVEEAKDYQSGGQSDAMFLLVTDPETMTGKIVTINRNTMTNITYYDKDGTNRGKTWCQICAQHGFGDGRKLSCNLALDAVKELFYNVPMDGYLAINMGALPMLNDYVGGVEVEVLPGLEDFSEFSGNTGDIVTLKGMQAYYYLRRRDIGTVGSADMRLARQEQYIAAYLPKFMNKINTSASSALGLYNEISDYLETNIDAVTLMNELSKYEFDTENMIAIPGETVYNDKTEFSEYHVDEDAFYSFIIDVFYNQVD